MKYKIMITERAEEHLDQILYHLLRRARNFYTAPKFLDNMEKLVSQLMEDPYQFAPCNDRYLESKGYRRTEVLDKNYFVVYKVEEKTVYLLGIYRNLEKA